MLLATGRCDTFSKFTAQDAHRFCMAGAIQNTKNPHEMHPFCYGFCNFVVQAIRSRHLVGGLLFQTRAKPEVTLQPNDKAGCDFTTKRRSQG